MSRRELTDAQWERLRPLLPPQKAWTGRPVKDHRLVRNGILWIDRTGAPWRDLPEHYGPWQTVATRFYRRRQAGIWDAILAALQQLADAVAGSIGRSTTSMPPSSGRTSMRLAREVGTARPRPSGVGGAGSALKSICGWRVAASRWRCCSRRGNDTRSTPSSS